MKTVVVVAATICAAALGWAWWETTRPIQWSNPLTNDEGEWR